MNTIRRRQVLQATSVGVGGLLAGCSLNPFECPDHEAVVIRVESTATTLENPLRVSELPAAQQPFLQRAIGDGEYRKCPYTEMENKEALRELSDTISSRSSRAENRYVPLEYEGEYYFITWFIIQDEAVV